MLVVSLFDSLGKPKLPTGRIESASFLPRPLVVVETVDHKSLGCRNEDSKDGTFSPSCSLFFFQFGVIMEFIRTTVWDSLMEAVGD